TSREALPSGKTWEGFKTIAVRPLTAERVPDYVATYAPADMQAEVERRIRPLISAQKEISPLFVRFAIMQALQGELASTSATDLVLQYIEALRAQRLDLSADDMVRAASIAGLEATNSGTTAPREIEPGYLRGVLAREARTMTFMNES